MKRATSLDIAQMAGLLEGEGCFRMMRQGSPLIYLRMTDLDVVLWAAGFWAVKPSTLNRKDRQTIYTIVCTGKVAVGWMLTMYKFLGARRRSKIREILAAWRPKWREPHIAAELKRELARLAAQRYRARIKSRAANQSMKGINP
jgi:hypothetical protein